MNHPIIHIEKDPQSVAASFANFLGEKVMDQSDYHIALSGGSTPRILFDQLARDPTSLPWDRIHLYWGDERCVPPDHEESNYLMTKQHLLDHIEIDPTHVHRVLGEADPQQESIRYGSEINSQLPRSEGLPVFDMVILGMGSDGHTASIFPHEMHLLESTHCCEVATHPETGQQRITLTGPVINAAKTVAFLVTGESKKDKVRDILEEAPGAAQYPAFHIKSTELHWFLDIAAAQ